jgi:membrane-anchored mycosin MYCP
MHAKRLCAVLLTVACGLALPAVTAPAASAQQCVAPGGVSVPVPWPQQWLAPDQVWPLSTGAGQRVAVVSTGIADNPLLAGHVTDRGDFTASGAGSDCLGVGTGVAGVIAAQRSDLVGFHGMAPDAQLLDAKVVGDSSATDQGQTAAPDTLAAGINWAVDRNATVIAVPTITYTDSGALRQAVQRALARNIVVVAAVGEVQSDEPVGAVPYPAAYDNVLGVGEIDAAGALVQGSRTDEVDLVAPGDNIVTTSPGTGLSTVSGTAFATAYVAGTAALTRAYRPQLSAVDVARRLLATATPAPEGAGSAGYGYGIVNPYHAVSDDVVAGATARLPGITPIVAGPEEQARQAAEERGDTWALDLAMGGLGLVLLVTAIAVFGPRGRRRRWRSGFAPAPRHRPEDERPEPPVELFADLDKRA